MTSSLQIWNLAQGQARQVLQTDLLIEAPNWSPDGSSFAFVRYDETRLIAKQDLNPQIPYKVLGCAAGIIRALVRRKS